MYEWLYLYAFVNLQTGESRFRLVPTITKAAYQPVMAAFTHRVGASEAHRVLVVEDGGGVHVPAPQGHPVGIETVRLPELQPVERLWTLTDGAEANRVFKDLDEFAAVLGERCARLETPPDLLTRQTLFHWWPL